MKKTAKFIKDKISEVGAIQRLYKMTPPLEGHEYVIVSAVNAMFSGPETFIFPADENGKITNFFELDGSFKGSLEHKEALDNAGYSEET